MDFILNIYFKLNIVVPTIVIPATQEAEIGRIKVWGQLGLEVHETPTQDMKARHAAQMSFQLHGHKNETLFEKITKKGLSGGMAFKW
jgi:hypothetical protein